MEKKGTLLIVTAVGVFLLAVLGAALILYSPMNSTTDKDVAFGSNSNAWVLPTNPAQSSNVQTTTPLTDTTSEKSSIEQAAKIQDVNQTSTPQPVNNTNTGTAPSVISTNSQPIQDLTVYSTNTTVIAKDGATTLDLTTPKTVTTTPSSSSTNESENIKSASSSTQNNVTKQTVAKTSTTTKSDSVKSSTISQKKVSVVSTETSKPVASYWVQAASYTNKANANEARDNLQAEEIPSEVFTYQKSDGITYYRLRVGPYLTESEANYWNKRIRLVDQFANSESYVTNSALPANN